MRHLITLFVAFLLLGTVQAQGTDQTRQDRLAIETVINTLFVETDNKDWSAVRDLFLDEIDVDFSSLGAEPGRMPADTLVGGWEQGLHAQKESHHMTTNHRVVVNGDVAEVNAQGYAYNRLLEPAGDGFWEVWGVYTLPLVRTDEGWRFSGITFDAKHSRGDALVPAHTLE